MNDSQRLQYNLDHRNAAIQGDPFLRGIMSQCLRNEYTTAKDILGDRANADRIGDLCGATMTLLEGRAERSPLRQQWACRAGCAFCCVSRVDVHAPQAVEIAQYLRAELPAAEREELRRRLSDRVRQLAKMTAGEHAIAKLPCVLLKENNTCLVHPVRPTMCATFNSCSAEKCQEAFGNPTDTSILVPFDLTQAAVGQGVMAGLGLACIESGLDHWAYELHSAVLRR